MSQNDLTIANQGFASFRSDLNSALQALGSTNSGTSAPSTTFANQLFYDTANNILKIRNEDNDAFISLFTLDQTNDNIEALTISGTLTYTGDLVSSTAGTSNFRAGVNAGNSIVSGGNFNTVVGDEAGTAISTGDFNTALGYASLDVAVLVNNNTAVGSASLSANVHSSKNVAIGSNSLEAHNFGSASDGFNTAVGYNSGLSLSSGIQNTLIGSNAGDNLTDADFNVAVGLSALGLDSKGNKSTAIGTGALSQQNFANITDTLNTAVGFSAGNAISTGKQNTTIGSESGLVFTTGLRNTLLGNHSGLALVTSNSDNTFVGQASGSAVTSGDANTIIGRYSGNANGLDIRTTNNNIVLSDGDGNPRIANDGFKTAIGSPTSAKTSTGTIEIKGTSANQSIITNTDNSGSYANGATLNFGNRSGVLIVNNWNNGNVELFVLGGGSISRFAGTGTGAGAISFTQGVYRWTNDTGSTQTVTHTFIQTRNDA